MRRFKNILVAFDGSPDSVLALEAAETLAKDNQSHLTVAYVQESSNTVVYTNTGGSVAGREANLYQTQTNMGPGPISVTVPHSQENHEDVVLHDDEPDQVIANAKSRTSGVIEVDYEIMSGKPAAELNKYAEENRVDLVVIGNRGISGVKKLFMGSVSKKVTTDAECAVLVVK